MFDNQRLTLPSYQPPEARSTARWGRRRGDRRNSRQAAGAIVTLAWLVVVVLVGVGVAASGQGQVSAPPLAPDARCSASLTSRLAPVDPDARNTYLVCLSPQALDDVRPPHWRIERLVAAEAFAGASPESRRALALLYGGTRLRVARGLLEADGFNPSHDGRTFDAYTLIEPAPSESLDATVGGTLIIRTRIVRPRR